MSPPTDPQADRLKAEGNALFIKKDFKGAYRKYTEALKHDEKNPILYSNRSACSLGLNRYLDASTDATKATNINPGYAKAWGRLAAARMGLGTIEQAVDAWARALSVLPVDGLTPAEEKQKDQYSSELAAAKVKLKDMEANPINPKGMTTISSSEHDKLPWKRATAMIPDLIASNTWNSSAWVIARAHMSWEEGMNQINQGHVQQTPAGPIYVSRRGAIESLTNALIEDPRIFHIADPNFASMYNKQVKFEITVTRAWSEGCSREVMQEVPKRLEAEGWGSVRPALSVTVRGWMMRAFIEDSLNENVETALDFYTSAIEVLNWGAERWKDVPNEQKGTIFEPTFVRGVKCLHLDALMKACRLMPNKYPLENLLAKADDILSELVDIPPQPHVEDIPFFLSFFRYPMGQAHAVRGFCFLNMAKRLREVSEGRLSEDANKLYLDASSEYLEAAGLYPQDDEHRAWFLHCGYHAQFDGGTTTRLLLLNLDKLENCVPVMMKIWEFTAVVLREAFKKDRKAREDLQYLIDTKQVELDSFVMNPRPGTVVWQRIYRMEGSSSYLLDKKRYGVPGEKKKDRAVGSRTLIGPGVPGIQRPLSSMDVEMTAV